jgi:hypothetical protein
MLSGKWYGFSVPLLCLGRISVLSTRMEDDHRGQMVISHDPYSRGPGLDSRFS